MGSYNAGDDLNLTAFQSGNWLSADEMTLYAKLTINSDWSHVGGLYQILLAGGACEVNITNNSTSNAIVVPFCQNNVISNFDNGIRAYGTQDNKINIQGNWITVGTSDGTANQVFTIPYTDHIPCVFVETAAGSDVFRPWINFCGANTNIHPARYYNELNGLQLAPAHFKVFAQGFAPANEYVLKFTSVSVAGTTNETITVSDTSKIKPGAYVQRNTSAGTAIVHQVLSGTTFKIVGSIAAGTVDLTIVNPTNALYTNQITFGNNTNGMIPPNGCKIKIPNILITNRRSIFDSFRYGPDQYFGRFNTTNNTIPCEVYIDKWEQPRLLTFQMLGYRED
jgi:hypothetical protein